MLHPITIRSARDRQLDRCALLQKRHPGRHIPANMPTYSYPVIIFDDVALYFRTGDVGQTFRIRLNSALRCGRLLLHLRECSIRIQFIALAIDNCY